MSIEIEYWLLLKHYNIIAGNQLNLRNTSGLQLSDQVVFVKSFGCLPCLLVVVLSSISSYDFGYVF